MTIGHQEAASDTSTASPPRRPQVLRGGTIIDGSGSERFRGDVRLDGDRIAEVGPEGTVELGGADIVDLDGLFVAPGFIDPHTHLDAQVLWDRDVTPSSWHGVTSVVMGNCGFGIAPTRPSGRHLVCRTLENVEGMPIEALEAGIDWSFESFPEYLELLRRRPVRTNVGAFVGHTPLRLFTMGDEASSRPARDEEIAEMCRLAAGALAAGALGIASSRARGHVGAFGAPVPSRLADPAELHALARTLGAAGAGIFQIVAGPDFETPEDFSGLASSAGRPVSWIPLFADGTAMDRLQRQSELGGEVWPQIACRPIVTQVTMANPIMFNMLPSFERVLRAPISERSAVYRDSEWRTTARLEADGRWSERWQKLHVKESVRYPELIDGPSLSELGRQRGTPAFDVMLDLALDEDLRTRFELIASNDNDEELGKLLADKRSFLGLSDAGAHVRELCDACYPTYLLGTWVRDREVLSHEDAVWRLTGHPADVFRLQGKGSLRAGFDADVVVFDPDRVAASAPSRVYDLPGGADRIVVGSTGIEHVWVNGTRTRCDGRDVDLDGSYPGRLLRSGPPAGDSVMAAKQQLFESPG
jgi:N-acyl-D-amino-acid deacylase